ncbi:D-alanyl-D-alanine carboxypeptidase [Thalassococcus profundi]|mgnify:CR=1 FL=1|uniref:D-alanyl-D-alanine carboxypeptidase n=2 Tax=Thalassococcus profundi TaxID=2282382 RepID=A0A369TJV2_9RHOB|nr:D-alanyl-D-alanine carboxypeptidase [Thalassococcus profundi]
MGLCMILLTGLIWVVPLSVMAAPYAAMVIDARSGEVLHSENADTRLHPASLTKMMTLYIAFEAVQNGEISMDTEVTISRNAAAEPPSKLGLRAGQKIKLRYLVRAAAVKSANDAATAIGEAIMGSEAAFARRMNRTAKALGMTRTTFKNMHGLTEDGHLSTARDMTILGRHVLYDYPQYYNLFSRQSTDAGIKAVNNTNRRMLSSYRGADGIKTGYTRAAGFNLVASAERGSERIIATVFGGNSTASRNAQVAKLLDLGFEKAPSRVAFRAPSRPPYEGKGDLLIAKSSDPTPGTHAKSIRVASAAVTQSLRPKARGGAAEPLPDLLVAEVGKDIDAVLSAVQDVSSRNAVETAVAAVAVDPGAVAPAQSVKPQRRPSEVILASVRAEPAPESAEVVSRVSTSGGRHWGINVGRYPSKYDAEKVLLKTALAEMSTLDGTLRKVVARNSGYDANFMGMTRDSADLACRRLQARQVTCFMIGPS